MTLLRRENHRELPIFHPKQLFFFKNYLKKYGMNYFKKYGMNYFENYFKKKLS